MEEGVLSFDITSPRSFSDDYRAFGDLQQVTADAITLNIVRGTSARYVSYLQPDDNIESNSGLHFTVRNPGPDGDDDILVKLTARTDGLNAVSFEQDLIVNPELPYGQERQVEIFFAPGQSTANNVVAGLSGDCWVRAESQCGNGQGHVRSTPWLRLVGGSHFDPDLFELPAGRIVEAYFNQESGHAADHTGGELFLNKVALAYLTKLETCDMYRALAFGNQNPATWNLCAIGNKIRRHVHKLLHTGNESLLIEACRTWGIPYNVGAARDVGNAQWTRIFATGVDDNVPRVVHDQWTLEQFEDDLAEKAGGL